MIRIVLLTGILFSCLSGRSQQVDSIFFHLYTDSLKKGTHNYINVDGKLSNGRWMPLTAKDITFSSSACSFSGNELIIPADCKEEYIIVKAALKKKPEIWIERKIWVKTMPDPDLPGKEEILKNTQPRKRRN
ncbi:MAG TPA: hypothetical protein PKC69_02545 [Chitinophagaceae bacterium]|nr:hypothetical protein [Chitinophagaceae bacterium]